MAKIEMWQLKHRQSLDLNTKILLSTRRIRDWYQENNGKVYVAFSGGKDSTVLLHLIRRIFPNVPAVFIDTGLEYPEIKAFVKTISNVTVVKPKLSFKQVIDKYGYPVVSKKVARQITTLNNPTAKNAATRNLYLTGIKRDGTTTTSFKLSKKWHKLIDAPFKTSDKCCYYMKKAPMHKYCKESGNKAFIGTMASDSRARLASYLQTGCNNAKEGVSLPLSFWLEKDIWAYIKEYDVPYCSIYDTGVARTGCVYCMFGAHLEKRPNRFELMQVTHPQLYDYCINKLELGKILDYVGVEYGNQKKLVEITPCKKVVV